MERKHDYISYKGVGKVLPYRGVGEDEEPVVRPYGKGLLVRIKGCREKPPEGAHVQFRIFSRRTGSEQGRESGVAYGCLERVLIAPGEEHFEAVRALLQNLQRASNFHRFEYSSLGDVSEVVTHRDNNPLDEIFERLVSKDYSGAFNVLMQLKISFGLVVDSLPSSDDRSKKIAQGMYNRVQYLGELLQKLLMQDQTGG